MSAPWDVLIQSRLQSTLQEERVELNQRHLIDKILARYSSDFTVFRELLQNANDAKATAVDVAFLRQDVHSPYTSIVVRNNGLVFSETDWKRVKSIAEGNPDEDKIGFFGVGFFSLFSLCEAPFIYSGGQCMAFSWKGDALYAQKGNLDDEMKRDLQLEDPWTYFMMQLRDPMPTLPDRDDFTQFLVTSLLFTTALSKLVWMDGKEILFRVDKNALPSRTLTFNNTASSDLFMLKELTSEPYQLQIDKRFDSTQRTAWHTFFQWANVDISKQEDKPGQYTLFMRTLAASCQTKLSRDLAKRMERTTKKMPPNHVTLKFILTSHDEFSANSEATKFTRVLPFPQQGHVFIGFQTQQTTGGCIHLAAPFIPTVERESIDFVDPSLQQWNTALLTQAGHILRQVYQDELLYHSQIYLKTETAEGKDNLLKHVLHWYQTFDMQTSTPNPHVAQILQSAFRSDSASLMIMTSAGAMPVSQARDGSQVPFLKKLPTALCLNTRFIQTLKEMQLLKPCSLQDVLERECPQRSFTLDEMRALCQWFTEQRPQPLQQRQFVERVQLILSNGEGKPLLQFKFIAPTWLPRDLPVDEKVTLPVALTRSLQRHVLMTCFPHCSFLSFMEWIPFIVGQFPLLCEPMLHVLYKEHERHDFVAIRTLLSTLACIPTQFETLVKPQEAYLPSPHLRQLFPHLPAVQLTQRRVPDTFLIALGVQAMPSIEQVWASQEWHQSQFVRFLQQQYSEQRLSDRDWRVLQDKALWQMEGDSSNENSTENNKVKRYRANDLYFPDPLLKSLNLPCFQYDSALTPETKNIGPFLVALGVKQFIPLADWLALVATCPNAEQSLPLLDYFTRNVSYYQAQYRVDRISVPFVHCRNTENRYLPLQCFNDESCAVMQFPIVAEGWSRYVSWLGIPSHPSNEALLDRLLSKSWSVDEAELIFSYLATRPFSSGQLNLLQEKNFIPWKIDQKVEYFKPRDVYLLPQSSPGFIHVDYSSLAQRFLQSCGVQPSPDVNRLALWLMKGTTTLNEEQYLNILKKIALDWDKLEKRIASKMREERVLLAYRVVDQEQQQQDVKNYCLEMAKNIYINDDTMLHQLFKPLSAPLDSQLEAFYVQLGSSTLSSAVEQKWTVYGMQGATRSSQQLQDRLLDRWPLLKDFLTTPPVSVQQCQSITLHCTLQGYSKSHDLSTSACYQKKSLQLFITAEYDSFEVAQVLLGKRQLKEALLVSTLLQADEETLKKRGFPVERWIQERQKKIEIKLKEQDEKNKLNEEMEKKKIEQMKSREEKEKPNVIPAPVAAPTDFKEAAKQLQTLFPDISPDILEQCCRDVFNAHPNTSTDNIVQQVCHLLNDESQLMKQSSQERMPLIKASSNENLDPKSASSESLNQKKSGLFSSLFGRRSSKGIVNRDTNAGGYPGSYSNNGNGSNSSNNAIVPQKERSVQPPQSHQNLMSSLIQGTRHLRRSSATSFNPSYTEHFSPETSNSILSHEQCRVIAGADLEKLELGLAFQCYVDKHDPEAYLLYQRQQSRLVTFTRILQDLSQIFNVDPNVIHLYSDRRGNTVAFNRNHALFFNIHHYLGSDRNHQDQLAFWFVVMCHELAHEFTGAHDHIHGAWVESYASGYLARLMPYLNP